MSCEWDLSFCLACERQTDGALYCSQACRLADYEKTPLSSTSSGASSPTLVGGQAASWTSTTRAQQKFYLSPAYDFSNPSPYGATPPVQSPSLPHNLSQARAPLSPSPNRRLSPSNSHSSLCSMQSTSSTSSETPQLSDKAAGQLRAYANSFSQVRTQRRRSAY